MKRERLSYPPACRDPRLLVILMLLVTVDAFGQRQARRDRSAAPATLGLDQGLIQLDTPEFTLTLVKRSQTVAALEPKGTTGFDFTPADQLDRRDGDGYYHLGDLTLRLRSDEGQPWRSLSTAARRMPVQPLPVSGTTLAPEIRDIDETLAANRRPVAVGIPGYILPMDIEARLFLKYPRPVRSLVVEPEGAIALTRMSPTPNGWQNYGPNDMPAGTYSDPVRYGGWMSWDRQAAARLDRSFNYPHVAAALVSERNAYQVPLSNETTWVSLHTGASSRSQEIPAVTAPPESFFELAAKRPRGRRGAAEEMDLQLYRDFYKKYIDVQGMPVVAAEVVADRALERTYEIVTHMLAGRPDVRQALVDRGMYLIIIGKDQVYTDMPENRNARNPDYLNERVRGTGGHPTSFGEENLLSLPLDRYDDESIGVHEFSHTIDSTLRRIDATWNERKNAVYRNALDKGLYKNAYAAGNAGEYWAEIAQAYFNCNRINNWNHGPVGMREDLKIYDPEGYELCRSTFNLSPEQDWHYTWLQPLPNVTAAPAKFDIDPYYTKFTWAREFTVLGRGASDEALLKANDTIRKMFAYRHDILKALMAEDLKLVVLGPHEALSDLPEYRRDVDIDHTARFLEYKAQTKILVVSQESVLGSGTSSAGVGSQVIRLFAKAFYHVTGHRPVDPNWENRGRDVQQYELRVQRLDVRFGRVVEALYERAKSRGLWKGTTAIHGPADYWAEGVLAYFDASGRVLPPNDAKAPIATREALAAYDPDLFALVEQTMAYHGKVDWRYR